MINTLEILKAIPEYHTLSIFKKNQLSQLIENKLNKISFKIQYSAFLPYERDDKLNLNRNFPEAFYKWLTQFPEDQRLGFLCAGLSVTYITQREFDQLFDIAIEKLYEAIREWDKKRGGVLVPKTPEANEAPRPKGRGFFRIISAARNFCAASLVLAS